MRHPARGHGRHRRGAPALAVAVAALAALAVSALVAPPAQAAPPPGPVLACGQGLCLLNPSGTDSDGDGFSDADEIAAGTDPHDPASHPSIPQLIHGYLDLELRPDGFPLREVVVLPTTTPDGKALNGAVFGDWPQRTDTMTRLGLTHPMLAEILGDDPVRAVVDLGDTNQAGRPPVRVGGIDVGLLSVASTTVETSSRSGTTEQGRWNYHQGIVRTNVTDGPRITTITSLYIEVGLNGTTSSMSQSTVVTNADGSMKSRDSTRTDVTKTDDKNKTTTTTTARTDSKGVTRTVRTESKTVDGQTTTTTTTTTTDEDGEVLWWEQTCEGADCPQRDSGEIDPAPAFTPGSTVTATPELTRRIEVFLGQNTTYGETPVEIDTSTLPEPPPYSPRNPGLVYIDPTNDAVWWTPELTLPDPNKVGGNITFVQGVTSPLEGCLPTSQLPCP